MRNVRIERVLFFLSLLFLGMFYAYLGGYGKLSSPIDLLTLLCVSLSFVSAWLYAIHVNDVIDIEIDTVSNQQRPLIKGELTVNEMDQVGYLWLAITLLGGWASGFFSFYMLLVFVAAAYIYSQPPLRLRVIPLLGSFLISIACLTTVLSGFFFVSLNKEIRTFPPSISFEILIILTLIINIKDIKDKDSDKKAGIGTLANMFGENSTKVIGLCFAFSILLIPFFLSLYSLYVTAIPTALMGYIILNKKPFVEKHIFILGLVFVISSVLLSLFIF